MASTNEKKATRCNKTSRLGNHELPSSVGAAKMDDFSKYDQWQRKERINRPPFLREKSQDTTLTFKVGTIHRAAIAHSAPAASVHRSKRVLPKREDENRKQKETIDTLKLKIRHNKQTTDMYRKRSKELVEMNLDIVSEIESQEHETYTEVKRLLRKYEKFRGSVASLNSHFAREISEVRCELEETKAFIQRKLEALEQQLEEKDRKLKCAQDELQVLRSYKDKEYPVKAMTIAKLHAELASLESSNQEEKEDLEHIIAMELGKYGKERVRLANYVTYRVTEKSIALMHPSLQDMAVQNKMMRKEIEFHKAKQNDLTVENKELAEEVAGLIKNPKTNLRLQLYPELFATRERCDPDTEMVLDIPKQEWLPL